MKTRSWKFVWHRLLVKNRRKVFPHWTIFCKPENWNAFFPLWGFFKGENWNNPVEALWDMYDNTYNEKKHKPIKFSQTMHKRTLGSYNIILST